MKLLPSSLVLPADAAIDLQLHTTFSDGTWTAEQLIDYLVGEQFGLVAITDHDRVDTAAALQQLAAQKQLPILQAVEMSASWRGEPTDSHGPAKKPIKYRAELSRSLLERLGIQINAH